MKLILRENTTRVSFWSGDWIRWFVDLRSYYLDLVTVRRSLVLPVHTDRGGTESGSKVHEGVLTTYALEKVSSYSSPIHAMDPAHLVRSTSEYNEVLRLGLCQRLASIIVYQPSFWLEAIGFGVACWVV